MIKNRLFEQALSHRKVGDNTRAIILLQELLMEQPQHVFAMYNLAAALGDEGNFEASLEFASKAIDMGLDSKPEPWLVLARAASQLAFFERAEKAYLKVLSLDPLNTDAHKELAQQIWMLSKDFSQSVAKLEHSIKQYPKEVSLVLLLADICGQMGRLEEQYRRIKHCYDFISTEILVKFYLSKAALLTSRFEEALLHSNGCIKKVPNDLQCLIHYINCLLALGHVEVAMQVADHATHRYPDNQHLIALRATCWRITGNSSYQKYYDYKNLVHQFPLGVPRGWSSLENYIDDLECELVKKHNYKTHPFHLSVRHGSQVPSIHLSNSRILKAYKEAVVEPMNKFISKLKSTDGYLKSKSTGTATLHSAWSVKLYNSGFHVNHVHQEGWLSSACHIKLPSSIKNKNHSGWLQLGQPGPVCKPSLEPEHFVEPKRGHIVIFPSYMWHGTVPFTGDDERITVAADFVS